MRSIFLVIGDPPASCAQTVGRVARCLIPALKTGLAMLALALPVASARAAPTCTASASRASILLEVNGFKRQTGTVNIWVYGSNPRDFLARDKRILRLAYSVPRTGPLEVCVALPGPGRYAIAAHHDVQSNGKRDISDGLGFSGNPRLFLLRLKPTYAQTSFVVGRTTGQINLVLLYRSGLSIKAVVPQSR